MSLEFSAEIQSFNPDFGALNSISNYNKYLQGQDIFALEAEATEFSKALDSAAKSTPLKDKNDPFGMGNFMDKISNGIGAGLDSINRTKLEADRLQEDLAMGGATSIHEAMIAAQKAELSMQMAVQVRNRIISAYTEINSMAL